jgi:uncharacterized protein (DUF3084 family)
VTHNDKANPEISVTPQNTFIKHAMALLQETERVVSLVDKSATTAKQQISRMQNTVRQMVSKLEGKMKIMMSRVQNMQERDLEREMRMYVEYNQEELKIMGRFIRGVEGFLQGQDATVRLPESKRRPLPEVLKVPRQWNAEEGVPRRELHIYVTEKSYDPKTRTEFKITGQNDYFLAIFEGGPSNTTNVIDLITSQPCFNVTQSCKLHGATMQ